MIKIPLHTRKGVTLPTLIDGAMLYQSFSHNNINFRTPKWKLLQTIQQIFTIGQLA